MQKRLLLFLLVASLVCLAGGYYLKNTIYFLLGLLCVGVLIGGVARWLLERSRRF
jgi:hypothetical protein